MKKSVTALIIAIFFTWGAPANAEEGPFEKLGAACGEQVEKLCPDVEIGSGRILACLEKNKGKISGECNEARVNAQKQFDAQDERGPFEKLGIECGDEIEKLCSKIALGKGRLLACLEENQDKISEGCNKARVNAQKQLEAQEPVD
jgi:hypothetical protein